MYVFLRYNGKIISFDLSTTNFGTLDYFVKNGAEIIEYKNSR